MLPSLKLFFLYILFQLSDNLPEFSHQQLAVNCTSAPGQYDPLSPVVSALWRNQGASAGLAAHPIARQLALPLTARIQCRDC